MTKKRKLSTSLTFIRCLTKRVLDPGKTNKCSQIIWYKPIDSDSTKKKKNLLLREVKNTMYSKTQFSMSMIYFRTKIMTWNLLIKNMLKIVLVYMEMKGTFLEKESIGKDSSEKTQKMLPTIKIKRLSQITTKLIMKKLFGQQVSWWIMSGWFVIMLTSLERS